MTSQPPTPIMIGPLTPDEWATFVLPDDEDPRNPLPRCCANASELRSALMGAFRVGGDPDLCWRMVSSVWWIVEEHLPVPITHPDVPPVWRKIYEAYVEGRIVPDFDDEARARMYAVTPVMARQIVESIPEAWDVDTAEGRMRALARVGGAFVGHVLDVGERTQLVRELAAQLGMAYADVAFAVDVLRLDNRLPYAPTEGARV